MHDTLIHKGRKFFLLPAADYREFQRLRSSRPNLPPADRHGNRPAVEFGEAMIARSIVRDRKRVNLSQKELARRAGIRVETLNRAERGVVVPDVRTLQKIEKAFLQAGLQR